MKSKSLILIVIACGCGLVASIGISQVMDRGGGSKAETVKILVALNDIAINDPLDAQNIKLEDWPKDRVPEGAYSKLEDVKDLFPRDRMYKGEPVLKAKLSTSKGGKTTNIPVGLRVVPISVERGVVTDLIQPGDKVDILVYMPRGDSVPVATTKTVLTMVPIWAVNDKTERAKDDKNETIQARTVSVLVKPDQVETLTLAQQLGKITLSLRSPGDKESKQLDGATSSELLSGGPSVAGGSTPAPIVAIPNVPKIDLAKVDVVSVPQGPVKKMVVHTPDGIKLYTWNGDSDVPEVITLGEGGGSTAPSAIVPVVPVSAPVGAPDAGDKVSGPEKPSKEDK